MEIDMIDPEDIAIRERFRRYGKRHLPSKSSEIRSNSSLIIENIKEELDSFDAAVHSQGNAVKTPSAFKRRSSIDSEIDAASDSILHLGNHSLKLCKKEDDDLSYSGDATFTLFAQLLDSTLQGLMPVSVLILKLEKECRDVSKSIRYGSDKLRIVEDKLMRQTARLLLDEAASWSLLWYLYGKGEDFPDDLVMLPTTSHLEACQFVVEDHTAQHCLRIIQWLEGLAAKALDLDNEIRGSHVGTHLPSTGIWHHTQRLLKKGTSNPKIIHHLDFDAPTREHAQPLPDDRKQDESLLEDIWILLRAGRLEEACNLCRSAGQPWRAATLCAFGGVDHFPSVEALMKNGKNRSLQAVELESGIGHQQRLWKWASFVASEKIAEEEGSKYEAAIYASQCSNLKRILSICTDWESACWAMAKSWFHVQVDLELARFQPGAINQFNSYEDAIEKSPGEQVGVSQPITGPESWPLQVLNQQPRNLSALLQKLHSSDAVHDAVHRGCKEQHRQIEMSLMLGDIPQLLDLIWSWISPSEDDQNVFRPRGDPQMIRFGAHLVLVLRYLLAEEMADTFKEKIMTLGDLIIHMYAMFLFSKQHEELVGIYASQLARHRCIDLFVHMMELRLNGSVHVRYNIFLSAIEYLPFADEDETKGSFTEIIERVLSRSREIKVGKYEKASSVAEQHRLQSKQKAMVIQWLCFTPPSTITDVKTVSSKLLFCALMHSNVLFREFSLLSMWRVPSMPVGAHTLLSLLAEPLNQLTDSAEDYDVSENSNFSENLKEFNDWREYYSCDAFYRNWLKIDLENAEVASHVLSSEEKKRAVAAARETLDSSLQLLQSSENSWLVLAEDFISESIEPVFLELHATAMLCLPSGECMSPDATVCTTLMSCLYSSVSEEVVLNRQLMVDVTIAAKDSYCINVVLRCLAAEGDGLGPHELNDGGLLATVIASGFKGELVRFQAGVTIEISRIDAWYSNSEGSLDDSATYIVRGLCRRCCIPEIILRCMQVSVSLMESGNLPKDHDEFIELVACPETKFLYLFSQQQLQELLLYEREYSICKMGERQDDRSPDLM
ncbi:nuclear pore complex protein NUP107 [Apium graveolens]|uniref:nuclear pore complex protein NUP107 n=1 Tax=Apium graveolens TaxID=4045 RepID=UPI003D7B1B32